MATVQAGQGPAVTPPAQRQSLVDSADSRRSRRAGGGSIGAFRKRTARLHGLESGVLDAVQKLTGQKLRRREKVVNMAWYAFLLIMLWIGGSATMGWIVNGGYRWGYKDGQAVSGVVVPNPTSVRPIRVDVSERIASAVEKIAERPVTPPSPQVVEKIVEKVVSRPPSPPDPELVKIRTIWDPPTVPAPPH